MPCICTNVNKVCTDRKEKVKGPVSKKGCNKGGTTTTCQKNKNSWSNQVSDFDKNDSG